jgi:LPXTG-motif cell wall-anchored protein
VHRFLVYALLFAIILQPADIVSSDNSLNLVNVTHSYEFGKSLTISATLPQPGTVRNISLLIQPDNQESRQTPLTIENAGEIRTVYDLSSNSIAPFSRVYYWFEAELNDGTMSTSPAYWFDYLDNRYDWKTNSTGMFNIYWTNGDASYGQKLQQIARSGLERATQLIPVVPNLPISIYIYPDEASFQSVLTLGSQAWVNGYTYLSSNRILVTDSTPFEDVTDVERTIPHEIMHLLQYQIAGSNYSNAPAWLTEGLATQTELYANPELQRSLLSAVKAGSLSPLSQLCLGISKDANQALVNYAQSGSLVDYIQQNYGNQIFVTMLQNSVSGLNCDQNVKSTLGISQQQLEIDWLNSISGSGTGTSSGNILFWVGIPALLIFSGIVVFLIRRRKMQPDSDS